MRKLTKVGKAVKTVLATAEVLAVVFIIGSIKAYEFNQISLVQMLMQIGGLSLVAYLVYVVMDKLFYINEIEEDAFYEYSDK